MRLAISASVSGGDFSARPILSLRRIQSHTHTHTHLLQGFNPHQFLCSLSHSAQTPTVAIREVVLRKPGKAALQDPNTFPEPLSLPLTEKRGGVTYEEERVGVRLSGRPKICRVSLTMPQFIHIATFRVERETYLNDNEEQYIGFSAAERERGEKIHYTIRGS